MQTVAILAFLDVAHETVDARDRLGGAGIRGKAKISLYPGGLRLGPDLRDQPVAARGVQPVCGGIFVKQAFQPV